MKNTNAKLGSKNKKQSGLTMLETLIAVTVTMAIVLFTVYWYMEKMRQEQAVRYGKEVAAIVTAFDKRIHVDGYDPNNFKNGLSWANNGTFISMLNNEFIAKASTCGTTNGWVPVLAVENTTKLIPCNLWTQIPYNMNASASIEVDSGGFIKSYRVVLKFPDVASFNKNMRYVNDMKLSATTNDQANITGSHTYYFANNSDPSAKISNATCLNIKASCVLVAQYSRDGGNEYLRVDGTNTMIGSTVTFKPSKDSNRLQCLKWFKSTAGAWTSSQVDCGIGIYNKTGYPVSVDVAADASTQNRVLLDKSCNVYSNSGNNIIVAGTSPCGMLRLGATGDTVYQVVERGSMDVGYINTLYNGTIYSNTVNTNYANVANDLRVGGSALVGGSLTVNGDSIHNGRTILNNELHAQGTNYMNGTTNVSGQLNTYNTANMNGTNNLNGTTNVGGVLNTYNVANMNGPNNLNGFNTLNGQTNVNSRMYMNEYLQLNRVENEGWGCGSNGLVARDSQGAILSCQNGIWKKQGSKAPVCHAYTIPGYSGNDATTYACPIGTKVGWDTTGKGWRGASTPGLVVGENDFATIFCCEF